MWVAQKLHTYGLLQRAFRPDPPIRRLRTLTRQRAELVLCGVAHQQHMHKAFIAMNLHLHLVVSDLHGETGMRIIEAIRGWATRSPGTGQAAGSALS